MYVRRGIMQLYVYTCMCMYIYIYSEREREREKKNMCMYTYVYIYICIYDIMYVSGLQCDTIKKNLKCKTWCHLLLLEQVGHTDFG